MIISGNKKVQYEQTKLQKNNEVNKEPEDVYISSEYSKKPHSHHIANAGFGASSIFSIGYDLRRLLKVVSRSKLAAYVPGLNAGVATLETYHTIKHIKNKDKVAAASSAGNALGCAGSVAEDVGTASSIIAGVKHAGVLKWIGSAFGVIGGVLGLVSGTMQIKEGKKNHSARTLTAGALDITSGTASIAGATLVATGIAAPIGIALLITASVVDLGGLAIDYLWKKSEKKEALEKESLAKENKPPEQPSQEIPLHLLQS